MGQAHVVAIQGFSVGGLLQETISLGHQVGHKLAFVETSLCWQWHQGSARLRLGVSATACVLEVGLEETLC